MPVGEWDERQLCPDGACVGVIGPDGTCKVCGRVAPNWGDERNRGLITATEDDAGAPRAAENANDEDDDEDDDDEDDGEDGDDGDDDDEDDDDGDDDEEDDDDEVDEAGDTPASVVAVPAAWGERQLCPDGSCIGLIGPDGRCKVCGRAAMGAPEPAAAPAAAETAAPVACADSACSGVLGADGRCAVCGKLGS